MRGNSATQPHFLAREVDAASNPSTRQRLEFPSQTLIGGRYRRSRRCRRPKREYLVAAEDHHGPRGGAANEGGSVYRANLAAWLVVHMLVGRSLPIAFIFSHRSSGMRRVGLEAPFPVDDLVIEFLGGERSHVQAKTRVTWNNVFREAIHSFERGWIAGEKIRLVLACGTWSRHVETLASALAKYRDREPLTGPETKVVEELRSELIAVPEARIDEFLASIAIERVDVASSDSRHATAAAEMLGGSVVRQDQGRAAFSVLARTASELARHGAGRT